MSSMFQSRFRTSPSAGAMPASAKQPFQDGVNIRLETLIFRPLQQLNGEEARGRRLAQMFLTFPDNMNKY